MQFAPWSLLLILNLCPLSAAESVRVKYGRVIQLRHAATNRALYSHAFNYMHPGGSGQQQVIAVDFHDSNSYWLVKPAHGVNLADRLHQVVKDGEKIRLEHRNTQKNLHTHDIVAPVSPEFKEVSCFGQRGEGDEGDDFMLKVAEEGDWDSKKHVALMHKSSGRYIFSKDGLAHDNYTAAQQEVSGGPTSADDESYWTAIVMDPKNCFEDGRCETLGAQGFERRVTMFEPFDDERFNDVNKDPDNVPKEISIFCPINPTVNIYDLDYAAQEDGNCLIVNLSSPNFDTRLQLKCGQNVTKFDI